MLQRQNVYVAKTKFICCQDRINMLQRQNLYVVKTNKHGARAERARRGFFLPEKDILIFDNTIWLFCLRNRQNTS